MLIVKLLILKIAVRKRGSLSVQPAAAKGGKDNEDSSVFSTHLIVSSLAASMCYFTQLMWPTSQRINLKLAAGTAPAKAIQKIHPRKTFIKIIKYAQNSLQRPGKRSQTLAIHQVLCWQLQLFLRALPFGNRLFTREKQNSCLWVRVLPKTHYSVFTKD